MNGGSRFVFDEAHSITQCEPLVGFQNSTAIGFY